MVRRTSSRSLWLLMACLLPPAGVNLRTGDWLVRSPDGLVKVEVDNARVWISDQNLIYDSPAAMQAAGAEPFEGSSYGGAVSVFVPEIVTAPWRVLAEPGRPGMDEVLERIVELDAYWDIAPAERHHDVSGAGVSLDVLFEDTGYVVNQAHREVQVRAGKGENECGGRGL